MGERDVRNVEVEGSTPLLSTQVKATLRVAFFISCQTLSGRLRFLFSASVFIWKILFLPEIMSAAFCDEMKKARFREGNAP